MIVVAILNRANNTFPNICCTRGRKMPKFSSQIFSDKYANEPQRELPGSQKLSQGFSQCALLGPQHQHCWGMQ